MLKMVHLFLAGACFEWASREPRETTAMYAQGLAVMLEAAARGDGAAIAWLWCA